MSARRDVARIGVARRGVAVGAAVVGALLGAAPARAQISLTFVGTPPTLTVSSATAGQAPNTFVGGGAVWSLLGVWALHPRIRAHLSSALPSGVRLEVQMAAPSGATSAGWVTLGTTPQDLVSNLPLVSISGLGVSYRLTATSGAGVVALSSRSVVFTLAWDP